MFQSVQQWNHVIKEDKDKRTVAMPMLIESPTSKSILPANPIPISIMSQYQYDDELRDSTNSTEAFPVFKNGSFRAF
tara:strand:+ start:174 stop:404 length:231 start_codon:yes stop_codon:yes gene_type:complete